jgi:hypothetical protein
MPDYQDRGAGKGEFAGFEASPRLSCDFELPGGEIERASAMIFLPLQMQQPWRKTKPEAAEA